MIGIAAVLLALSQPECNDKARVEVAKRYSLEDLERVEMMRVITNSDILTRSYNILRERCLKGVKG